MEGWTLWLGVSEEKRVQEGEGEGGWAGLLPRAHVRHKENTTHKDGAPWGSRCGLQRKVGSGDRRDDRTALRGGGQEEGAGAQLGSGLAGGTYTEVIPTWPAPSPLSQPHGMVHTEKTERRK